MQQRSVLTQMLNIFDLDEFHHGDCVGVDQQAAVMVRGMYTSATIHNHPPDNPKYRAYTFADHLHEEKPYLKRNADIVAASDLMIACPATWVEQARGSGTWACIRECGRQGKSLTIIYPTGETEHRPGVEGSTE